MNEQNDRLSNNDPLADPNADKRQRSPEEFAADQAVQKAAVQIEHGAEINRTERCREIGLTLFDLAETTDGQKHLAPLQEDGAYPDAHNDCLFEAEQKKRETDPAYDITTEPAARLAMIIKMRMRRRAAIKGETSEVAEKTETETIEAAEMAAAQDEEKTTNVEARTEETLKTAYEEWANSKSDFKAMIDDADKMPVGDPPTPERLAMQARLKQFQSILTIANANPADKAIVTASLAKVDMSNPPTAASFARSFIFDDPESNSSSGVSEATQDAIATSLGIERRQYAAKTGGDINDIYKKGIGSKTVRDPETGELREEPLFMKPGDKVEIRDGQYVGLSDHNKPIMNIVGEHSYTADLPDNPTDHDMTMYGLATQWIAKLNDVNMAEMFFPHSKMERGGGHIKLNMPDDFQRAQKLSQIFFGAMAGYNGELPDQTDLDKIPHLMQFQSEKGDAVLRA